MAVTSSPWSRCKAASSTTSTCGWRCCPRRPCSWAATTYATTPSNAAILDRNARRLADLGYDVVRIPMPTPYCQDDGDTCVGTPDRVRECDGTNTRVWATYLNSIRQGDVMAVPVYRWVPPSQAWRHHGQEREALATYQWALDREFGAGAVKVVPIPSDTLIPCQGSLHCITKTFPKSSQ